MTTIGAYLGGKLAGFVQYGETAIGFADNGEITDDVSYPVIRNLYFAKGQEEIGGGLLDRALTALSGDRIYAFFHYFGMSCYARHGKLFGEFGHIHDLLLKKGFVTEHENVFYSSRLNAPVLSAVCINWHEPTAGRQQYCDFVLGGEIVGGGEVHFLERADIAYLRWIFVDERLRGKGVGTKCISALMNDLYQNGVRKFDTDTAVTNTVAQRFYEKNGFAGRGITRSYYMDSNRK